MTEKQDFLERLNAALLERDISENDIAPYLERFDRFYDRMVRDSENTDGELLSDVERIADNIAEQVSERYDEINRLAERTLTVDRVKSRDDTKEDSKLEADETQLVQLESEDEPSSSKSEQLPEVFEDEPEEYDNRPPEYIDEEPSPNSTIFWVLCAVSLPITLPLALVGLGLFLGVWAALAVLIAASIAALVAVAAVGTALALVGIIYGISQLFSQLPVGLYELGLGVLIGSVAMFGGILIYNFAIRLLPLLMRLWGKFFGYVCRRLRVLFGFLRRECAKL